MHSASTASDTDECLIVQSQEHLLGLTDSVAFSLATDIAKLAGHNNAQAFFRAQKRLEFIERSKKPFLQFSLSFDKTKFQGSDIVSHQFISKLVEEQSTHIRDLCLAKLAEEEAVLNQRIISLDDPPTTKASLAKLFKEKRVDNSILTSDVLDTLYSICTVANVAYMQILQSKQAQEDLERSLPSSDTRSAKRPAPNQGQGTDNFSSYQSTSSFYSPNKCPPHREQGRPPCSGTWKPAETLSYSRRRATKFFKKKSNCFSNNSLVDINKLTKQLYQTPPPHSTVSNKGVYNITNLAINSPPRELTTNETNLLSLGLKHIITPNCIDDNIIIADFNKYCRSIRLRYQFFNSPPDDTPAILRIPNPDYQPKKASYLIEKYMRTTRKKIFSKLRQHKTNTAINTSLNAEYYTTIQQLKDDSTIVILKADKSAGIVIANRQWYIYEIYKLLNNTEDYIRVLPQDLPSSESLYNSLIHILHTHGQLYIKDTKLTRIAEYMLQLQNLPLRFSVLYGLVKMHKATICLRPILSCIGSATYHASKFIDWKLKSVMTHGFSYLKDSRQLLLLLQDNITQTNDSMLLSADVVSLYPSIDLQDAYIKIRTYLTENSTIPKKDIDIILDLLIWIMENNYCKFSDTYFRQLRGVAMGQPCAVVFAVIYLLQLEKELLDTINIDHHPILFKRFIDDVFAIFKNGQDAKTFIDKYNNLHNSIKLTSDIAMSVTIMDLTVTIHPTLHTIKTTLYQKPTNKYLYLTPLSFHQPTIFFNFINSELKRYCLYCSDTEEYNKIKLEFHNRLLSRGYTKGYLFHIFTFPIHRTELLSDLKSSYNTRREETVSLEPLVFVTTRTPRTERLQLQKCLTAPESVFSTVEGSAIFNRIIVCNKTTSNLQQLLITSNFTTPVADEYFATTHT